MSTHAQQQAGSGRTRPWRMVLFGANGAIGQAVLANASARGWQVLCATRKPWEPGAAPADQRTVCCDPLSDDPAKVLAGEAPFDAVCWAHGANLADSVERFDVAAHSRLYEANCLSVMASAAALLSAGFLSPQGARLVAISSIWQERARQDKLSYCVTKAALGGFVRSAAVDLGLKGHLVNAVLPGVLDTPMAAANLSPRQIEGIKTKTPAGRLPDLATVAETVTFLCSPQNTAINGQSITVDLGMCNASII